MTRPRARVLVGVALAVALAVALLVRVPALPPSLWLDEVWSMRQADLAPADLLRSLRTEDAHPPLYYLALKVWSSMGRSEAWLRGLSLLASLLHLGVLFALGRAMGGPRAGALALLLGAASSVLARQAVEVRSFALFDLLASAAWLSLVQAIRTGRARWWVGLTAFTALALYTFYYAVHVGVALAAFLLAAGPTRRQVVAFGLAMLAAGLAFLPWLPTVRAQMRDVVAPATAAGSAPLDVGAGALAHLVVHDHVLKLGPWGQGPVPWAVLAIAALAVLARGAGRLAPADPASPAERRWLRAILWMSAAFLALVLLAGLAGGYVRAIYASFLAGAWCVATGLWLARRPPVLLAALLVAMVGLGGAYATREAVLRETEDWRGATRLLEAEARPGDVVWFMASYTRRCVAFYDRGAPLALEGVPEDLRPGAGLGPRLASGDDVRLAEALRQRGRVWMVWSHAEALDGPRGPATVREAFGSAGRSLAAVHAFQGLSIERYD
jgi:hypothetical protein